MKDNKWKVNLIGDNAFKHNIITKTILLNQWLWIYKNAAVNAVDT